MEENPGNETILANGTMSCSLNASEYVFMPEDKEGLRDCSPCILKSELNVSIVKTLAKCTLFLKVKIVTDWSLL